MLGTPASSTRRTCATGREASLHLALCSLYSLPVCELPPGLWGVGGLQSCAPVYGGGLSAASCWKGSGHPKAQGERECSAPMVTHTLGEEGAYLNSTPCFQGHSPKIKY